MQPQSSSVQNGICSILWPFAHPKHLHGQDSFDDNGWGCAYRSLQTCVSWYRMQHYVGSEVAVPSIPDIQRFWARVVGAKRLNLGGRILDDVKLMLIYFFWLKAVNGWHGNLWFHTQHISSMTLVQCKHRPWIWKRLGMARPHATHFLWYLIYLQLYLLQTYLHTYIDYNTYTHTL